MGQLLRRQVAAGGSAERMYRSRYRHWRNRTRLVALVATLPVLLLMVAFSLAWPAHRSLYLGFGVGAAAALVLAFGLAAPEHIDRWRRGAEAEKRTAGELARLVRQGWTVVHDLATPNRGNIDHVAIAPSGEVFLLDTKAPGGLISVEQGVLRVTWLEDPEDGYERDLTPRMKAAAASLSGELSARLGHRLWVTPIVVIWGRWDGKPHIHDGVAWVPGDLLAERLGDHSGEDRPELHARVARSVASLKASAPA